MEQEFYPQFSIEKDEEEKLYTPDFREKKDEQTLSSETAQGQGLVEPPMQGYSSLMPAYRSGMRYQERLALMQCQHNYNLSEAYEKAAIDVNKKMAEEENKTKEVAKREMNRADIASIGSLQRTFVNISSSGQVVVGKEQFGKDLSGMAGFWVAKCRRLFCLNDDTSSILQAQFCRENMTSTLFLLVEEMNAKSIGDAFREAGIAFGFKSAKEKFCRELLIAELLKMAEKVSLPKNHGWYRSKDELCYAYPEDETWEEVKVYAR